MTHATLLQTHRPQRQLFLAPALTGLLLLLPGSAHAQFDDLKKPQPGDERSRDLPLFSQGLFLATQPGLIQKFEAAQDYIDAKKWEKAVVILQGLLDAPEDVFVPLKRQSADGKEHYYWNTQRAEADHLLDTLPPAGLEFYQITFNNQARALLEEARKGKDPEKLAVIAQRFLHTTAGAEAAAALGSYHLDRGRPLSASLCFQRLLERYSPQATTPRPAADKLPPIVLFQSALASEGCGDKAGSERAWKLLSETSYGAVELNGKRVPLDDLRQELNRTGGPHAASPALTDCLVYRGQPDRQGLAVAGTPVLEAARWRSNLEPHPQTRAWLELAVKQHEVRHQAVLPALYPIAVGGNVFARPTRGVVGWEVATGKLLWWESQPPLALDTLAEANEKGNAATPGHVDKWFGAYQNNPHILIENSVIGSLSSDGRRVFGVQDIPVPPYPANYAGFLGNSGMGLKLADAETLTDAVYHSRLVALDTVSGKVLWERGERTVSGGGAATPQAGTPAAEKPVPNEPSVEDKAPLNDSFLLGPPLPLKGKLYLLSEKDQNLRLLCLNPEQGEVLWTQPLALTKSRMVLDGGRRLHAAHLAFAEGVMVCPTNAGSIIAVDLLSHSLLWAHAYHEEPPPPQQPEFPAGGFRPRMRPIPVSAPPNLTFEWKTTAPIIIDGKVVFAAPDDANLHCLNLRDGQLLWKMPKDSSDEVYLAGVSGDKVLIVTQRGIRARNLADGKPLWGITAGLPSGQGVLVGDRYLLPVKAADKTKEAGVCVIDLDKGEMADFLASPTGEVPGNLIVADGTLLSQGLFGVTAYPLKIAKPEGGR